MGSGIFYMPMALSCLNEDTSALLEEVVDLDETVRCLSQEERKLSDPKVDSRSFIRVGTMARAGVDSVAVAWEHHLVRGELVMAHTILCVEAIKVVETVFSATLQSLASMKEFNSTVDLLYPVMEKVAQLRNHLVSPGNLWSTLPFGIFCSGLEAIIKLRARSDEDGAVLHQLLADAKRFFMKVVHQCVDGVLERSYNAGVVADEKTLLLLKWMCTDDSFVSTVKEWAAYSIMRKGRNQFAHPWRSLIHKEKIVYIRNFERVLNDDFAADFRRVGELAKLALKTEDAEDFAVEAKENEEIDEEYMELIKIKKREQNLAQATELANKIAADEALELSQFHVLCG